MLTELAKLSKVLMLFQNLILLFMSLFILYLVLWFIFHAMYISLYLAPEVSGCRLPSCSETSEMLLEIFLLCVWFSTRSDARRLSLWHLCNSAGVLSTVAEWNLLFYYLFITYMQYVEFLSLSLSTEELQYLWLEGRVPGLRSTLVSQHWVSHGIVHVPNNKINKFN